MQSLLETCMVRIERAQRHGNEAALDAALHLVQPIRSARDCYKD